MGNCKMPFCRILFGQTVFSAQGNNMWSTSEESHTQPWIFLVVLLFVLSAVELCLFLYKGTGKLASTINDVIYSIGFFTVYKWTLNK